MSLSVEQFLSFSESEQLQNVKDLNELLMKDIKNKKTVDKF